MTTEFNLSKKIQRFPKMGYSEEDVKECIRIFKERTRNKYYAYDCINETLEFLDKLVGEKLK